MPFLFEPEAFTTNVDDGAAMEQALEGDGSHNSIAGKDFRPIPEALLLVRMVALLWSAEPVCQISVSFAGDSINNMMNGENYHEGNTGLGFTVYIPALGAVFVSSVSQW